LTLEDLDMSAAAAFIIPWSLFHTAVVYKYLSRVAGKHMFEVAFAIFRTEHNGIDQSGTAFTLFSGVEATFVFVSLIAISCGAL
jgi:hypothetical protein